LAVVSYDIVYASCGVKCVKDMNMGLCKSKFVAPVEHLVRVGAHLINLVTAFLETGMASPSTGIFRDS
jgi:hypothetical protein